MGRPSKVNPAFKTKEAVEALQEKEPLAVLTKKYHVTPSVITSWKKELLQNSSKTFESNAADKREVKQLKSLNERLLRKVGQLTLECDFFFCTSLRGCRTQNEIVESERQRPAGISRNRFCQLKEINRSSLYYEKKGENAENLELMKLMRLCRNYSLRHNLKIVMTEFLIWFARFTKYFQSANYPDFWGTIKNFLD